MDTTNKMVCVLGRTCSGKDSLTKYSIQRANDILKAINKPQYEILVSYTTRPKRKCETDGVEHIFISEEEYNKHYHEKYDNKLAYTEINGYKYFTLYSQVADILDRGNIPLYIIDPTGLIGLINKIKNMDIYKIYVHASKEERLVRYMNRKLGTVTSENIKEYYNRSKSENNQFYDYELNIFNCNYQYDDSSHILYPNIGDSAILRPNIVLLNETKRDFNINKYIIYQTLLEFASN